MCVYSIDYSLDECNAILILLETIQIYDSVGCPGVRWGNDMTEV